MPKIINHQFIVFLFLFLPLLWGNRILAQDTIILSYVKHPQLEETYIPLLASVYKELGLPIQFVAMPLDRAITSINNQLVDGDVMRYKKVLNRLDNIVIVSPPLTVIKTAEFIY